MGGFIIPFPPKEFSWVSPPLCIVPTQTYLLMMEHEGFRVWGYVAITLMFIGRHHSSRNSWVFRIWSLLFFLLITTGSCSVWLYPVLSGHALSSEITSLLQFSFSFLKLAPSCFSSAFSGGAPWCLSQLFIITSLGLFGVSDSALCLVFIFCKEADICLT